jgi:hypothetical protein
VAEKMPLPPKGGKKVRRPSEKDRQERIKKKVMKEAEVAETKKAEGSN